jgi:hypothetical protein
MQGEELKIELLIDLIAFLLRGGDQQIVRHIHEQAQIAGGMLAEGLDECGRQEVGVASGFEQVLQMILEFLGGQWVQTQTTANAAGDGQQVGTFEAVR